MSAKHSTVYSVQTLRAVAAILVVFYHAQGFASLFEEKYGLFPAFIKRWEWGTQFGAFGVDLFFVISGFVMAFITWRTSARTPKTVHRFFTRRIIRIVPIYWFYTFVMLGLLFVSSPLSRDQFEFQALLKSLLFIPYTATPPKLAPILAVGWTLSYEMYFYLLVGFGLFLPKRWFIISLGVFFSVSVSAPLFLTLEGPVFYLLTNSLIFEFYAGFLIGAFFVVHRSISKGAAWSAIVFGVGLLIAKEIVPCDLPRGLVWGGAASCALIWALAHEQDLAGIFRSRIAQALGASSYTLYLTHTILILIMARLVNAMGLFRTISPDIFILIMVVGCIVGGYVLFLAIEVPLVRILGRLLVPRAPKVLPDKDSESAATQISG